MTFHNCCLMWFCSSLPYFADSLNYSVVGSKFALMKLSLRLLPLFFLLLATNGIGQIVIPKGYFSSPLGIGLTVTGAFGEIRPNHFHSGIDFSVLKKEGMPVYAIADGFVSRIKISPFGFGNALYIDHPNGFTSVCGHLFGYSDTIRSYARQQQYSLKSFEVDLFPAGHKDTIWVKKGELIGYAGNSGGSFGAHLHFEIRNTKTERIINPLLFGFECKDSFNPDIDWLCLYPANSGSTINGLNQVLRKRATKRQDGFYHPADGDTISVWGGFAVGTQAFDFFGSSSDRNGWYSVKIFDQNRIFFSMQLDSFAFAETRYINASMDYEDAFNNGSRIIQSRKLPGNELSVIKNFGNRGVIDCRDGQLHEILVEVSDFTGRKSTGRFFLKSEKPEFVVSVPSPILADTVFWMPWQKENKFQNSEMRINLPKGCLFDSIQFTYSRMASKKGNYSALHGFCKPEIPMGKKMQVSIKADMVPARLRSKALLARYDREGVRHSAGGEYRDGFVTAETNLFDSYAIVVDTLPPSIQLLRDKQKIKKSIKFRVSDNFSGIDTYFAEVNGEWALVEWDPKNHLMVYWYDDLLKKGTNSFKLVLVDEKGNRSSFSSKIVKK